MTLACIKSPTSYLRGKLNMEKVELLGAWASPFTVRVLWALKLKGIPYEYLEQDLSHKSPLLLQLNPVHKKVPVLVHGGKPICESSVILEYIEQTWPHNPLLPPDPHDRALARFWLKFGEDKGPALFVLLRTTGKEQEKAKEESLEMLTSIEEHGGLGEKKFLGGEKMGMADVALGWLAHWIGVMEDVTEVKLLEPHKFPHIHEWIKRLKEESVIKENLPNYDEMLALFKQVRESALGSQ